LPVLHERGYLIPAINNEDVDYEQCARLLRESILDYHSHAHVTIMTRDHLPEGDQGGFNNDWQCFRASPYRQTIKLEADMIAAGPIDHWWTVFESRDVVISVGARDLYDQSTDYRGYRKIFDDNNLPDVYNAITYWRLSTAAKDFFDLVKSIFQNWSIYRMLLKYPDEDPTTDVVYAIAAQIMGPELVTLPSSLGPKIVHMKKHIIHTKGHDWSKEMIWETNPLRVNTVAQWGLVHYHVKDWARKYQDGR
jgi:hypothetical protein